MTARPGESREVLAREQRECRAARESTWGGGREGEGDGEGREKERVSERVREGEGEGDTCAQRAGESAADG